MDMDTHAHIFFFQGSGGGRVGDVQSRVVGVHDVLGAQHLALELCVCVHMCTWREEGAMRKEEEGGGQTASETKA